MLRQNTMTHKTMVQQCFHLHPVAEEGATLFERREVLTLKLFDQVTANPQHKLHKLLPAGNNFDYSLRNSRKFVRPLVIKTNRCTEEYCHELSIQIINIFSKFLTLRYSLLYMLV